MESSGISPTSAGAMDAKVDACSIVGGTQLKANSGHGQNTIRLEMAGKLMEVKNETTASFRNMKENIMGAKHEYDYYSHKYKENFTKEGFVMVKIPEKDILGDVMATVGLKKPKFSTTVVQGDKLRGSCKLTLPNNISNTEVGTTKVKGDLKLLAHEAESSAAAAAISYLERSMNLEIVDINYKNLIEEKEELQTIQELKENYVTIAHAATVEWRRMIRNIKDIINTQMEFVAISQC